MSRAVNQWLKGLGLSKYAGLFAENELDFDVLPDLTKADLKDLGIPLGDRKRLLKAIASLSDRPAESSTPEARPAPSADAERDWRYWAEIWSPGCSGITTGRPVHSLWGRASRRLPWLV